MFWPDKSLVVASCPSPLFWAKQPTTKIPARSEMAVPHGPSIENLTLRQTGGETGHSTWPKGKAKAGWITNDGAVSFGMFFGGGASFSLVSPYISPHTVMNDKHYESLKSLGYMYIWWSEVARIGLEPERAQGNKGENPKDCYIHYIDRLLCFRSTHIYLHVYMFIDACIYEYLPTETCTFAFCQYIVVVKAF